MGAQVPTPRSRHHSLLGAPYALRLLCRLELECWFTARAFCVFSGFGSVSRHASLKYSPLASLFLSLRLIASVPVRRNTKIALPNVVAFMCVFPAQFFLFLFPSFLCSGCRHFFFGYLPSPLCSSPMRNPIPKGTERRIDCFVFRIFPTSRL
ncbi:hypothetical protein FA15DRAFT_45365 [Coprinopsis marcescibilis]|uniref:Transmembrane protein n=1 Tax=Coprinopsis marcescibilis TaxID=230819 RepID=A0A5C3KQ39_COPMA|nr:hypothetical protein FA15DRAFT_45365 [Coprinopsis marcescibilis]